MVAGLLAAQSTAFAGEWPRLHGGTGNPICHQAETLANSVFNATSASSTSPIVPPKDFPSTISVHAVEEDISGGDALKHNPVHFERIEGRPWLYWQIAPDFGTRLVVEDQPFNWRGDWYFVFALNEHVTKAAVIADVAKDETSRTLKAVIGESWQPPIVLRDNASGHSWIVTPDENYVGALPGWSIYSTGTDGLKQRCTIAFMPAQRYAVYLLPPAVRRFAKALDATLGSGANEGTLQSTAGIRMGVDLDWADVALRPWALNKAPYNWRAEVDDNLRRWSHGAKSFTAVYRAIRRTYPEAERALADYYRHKFHLTAKEARASAAYAIDVLYRSYFAFHSEHGYFNKETHANPWPRGVRS